MTDNIVTLSFSTIQNCLQPDNSHNWLNKQMGKQVPDQVYFGEGKACHRIIQDHVAGTKKDARLSHIPIEFEIVEEIEKDPRTEFVFNINEMATKILGEDPKLSKQYNFHGFRDGLNKEKTSMLEIKSSSTLWSIGKFMSSIQRKCYGIDGHLEKAYLITCPRDPQQWGRIKPKYFSMPFTEQDRREAITWILAGVRVLETGTFSGGLVDGQCALPRCSYGYNCHYRG